MKKLFTIGFLTVGFMMQVHAQDWNQIMKSTASDRATDDFYGISVDISGDFAVVGASSNAQDENQANAISNAGSVYVLNKDVNGDWVEYQKLVASDRSTDDYFGSEVSISDSIIVVGAYYEDEDEQGANTLSGAGSAYIYKLQLNGDWIETQKIVASDRAGLDGFGYAVDIDGHTIIIGASQEDHDVNGLNYLNRSGSAYVFEMDSNGDFVETQKIVASDRIELSNFGLSVAVNDDQIIVGAAVTSEDENGQNFMSSAGAAYIYKKTNGTWVETQKIVASDRSADSRFGESVAIAGNTVVVGALYQDTDEGSANFMSNSGSAYIFDLNQAGFWVETQKIVAADRSSSDYFGNTVSMNNETIIVGAYWSDLDMNGMNSVSSAGSAYVFVKNSNDTWFQVDKLVPNNRAIDDYFGIEVDIDEVNNIIVGSYRDDEDENEMNALNNSGSAYIFEDCRSYASITVSSCVSHVSPSGNYTFTQSGIYKDTIPNANLCDSVITINLTITNSTSSTVNADICQGSNYTYADGTTANNILISQNYTSTLVGENGCDSVVTENLNVISFNVGVTNNVTSLIANESGASYQWIDCDNGNQPISGETNQTFMVSVNGNYAVEITKNGCTQTSACVGVNTLNVMENQKIKTTNIYPNPTNANVTIETSLPSSVSIVDLNGKVVYVNNNTESNKINVNVSIWETGIYFIQVINQNGLSTQKLIVQ